MDEQEKLARFELEVLPHLDAAYNLARWVTGNENDAEDVVQESCLRALKFFGGFRGGNIRAWLLTIVRNTGYTWLKQNRPRQPMVDIEDEIHAIEDVTTNADIVLTRRATMAAVREAMEQLPLEFREVIILREMEGLSYKEIADVAGVPLGTVMSRLARGRKQLQQFLSQPAQNGSSK